MANPPPASRQGKKSKNFNLLHSIIVMLMTFMSLSTDAFGAMPPSELSQNMRNMLAENLPQELIEPLNTYLNEINAPIIPTGLKRQQSSNTANTDQLAQQLAEEMAAAIVREQGFATAEATSAGDKNLPSTQQSATSVPTTTATKVPTQTPISTPIAYIPPPTTNKAPQCSSIAYSNNQTTAYWPIALSTYCRDLEGDGWSIKSVGTGANGTASFSGQTLYYYPNDGFVGVDTITFTTVDGLGHSSSHSAKITINNSAPIASNTSRSVYQNSSGSNIILNISDPGNDPLTIINIDTITTGMTGAAIIAANGQSIVYSPVSGGTPSGSPVPTGQGFTGLESLIYTIEDSHGATATATLYIYTAVPYWCGTTTGDANTGCIVSNIQFNGSQQTTFVVKPNTLFTFRVDAQLWNTNLLYRRQAILSFLYSPSCVYDNYPGTYPGIVNTTLFSFTSPAVSGTYYIFESTYDLDTSFPCSDALLNYGDSGYAIATVIVNSPPTCSGFNHSAPQGASQQTVNIQAQCSDLDGNPFVITNATNAQGATGGTLTYDNNNIYYTPDAAFLGTDEITFTIDDGISPAYSQTFDMLVYRHPIAAIDSFTVTEGISTILDVKANDVDAAGHVITITSVSGSSAATLNGSGQIEYVNSVLGADSFTYTISDGTYTDTATVLVIVTPKPIIMYNAGTHDGNLGGRSGANALCAASMPAGGYTNSLAFITVSSSDRIADIVVPTNLPIESISGYQIASNWSDLLDGSIDRTLSSAGILPSSSAWWSGSTSSDGTGTTDTCNNWTATGAWASAGSSLFTDQNWIFGGYNLCNNTSFYLLCIAYP